MATITMVQPKAYALATGHAAVRRLHALHDLYGPAGRRVLREAGLRAGMNVADFGCGVGATTRMIAEMVGPRGSVTGVDVNGEQLEEARRWCESGGLKNTQFRQADAGDTGLASNSYDLVYCRFLLLHLPDPMGCLREMKRVLRPGGTIVVEDGDLASATSVPASAMNAFGELFGRFGERRGLDYSVSKNLYHMVAAAGFEVGGLEIHQPAITRGENRYFLKWSVEEAKKTFVEAGIATEGELERTLSAMQRAIDDPEVVILAPRMSQVWARKER